MTTTTATRTALRSAKTVKLEPDITERVQRLAAVRNRSSHWLMQEAIRQYVEREEPRELMRQDALAAWSAYQATGMHVTHAEADAWLAQLEAGHDVEPPACHV